MILLMIIVVLIAVGLCLGSFVNALVWRVHEQAQLKSAKGKGLQAKLEAVSISRGRSMCPHCKHQLATGDLVPVLSWVSLRGKCRYCKKPISWQYPAVELLTAGLFVLSYVSWPHNSFVWTGGDIVTFILWLVLLTGLVALAVYDLKWYLLPDRLVLPLTIMGVVFVLVGAIGSQHFSVLGSIIGAVAIAGLFYALFEASKEQWIGGGDVKLAPLLGLLAGGFFKAMLLLFIASVLGSLYSMVLMALGREKASRKLKIPFGPFLITACVVTVLYGQQLIDWYMKLVTI